MRVSEGATIAAAWTVRQFQAVAPAGADGQPLLAQALSDAQLQRVARELLQRCDAADGQVQDPAGCQIAPQANALTEVMAGPRNRQGPLYFGWPWGPGIADAGWRAWTLGTAQQGAPNARHTTLMAGALGHELVTPPDPGLNTLNFNFETDPARMAAFHAVYDTADDRQLAGWRQRGGKLLAPGRRWRAIPAGMSMRRRVLLAAEGAAQAAGRAGHPAD